MEKEVEFRFLGGESITIKVPPDRTIHDLKGILRESFLPATNSPSFHLFFKGSKLSLEAQVDSLAINHGEFVVVVPFAKKSQQPSATSSSPEWSAAPLGPSGTSYATESAWQDIKDDLSLISDTLLAGTAPKESDFLNDLGGGKEKASMAFNLSNPSSNKKRRLCVDKEDVIREILSSGVEDLHEQQTRGRICQVVESMGCLLDPDLGCCLLVEDFCGTSDKAEKCMCPPLLKRLLKIFTLLNLFYAFFHKQHQCMTWDCLETALKQPCSLGVDDISLSDIQTLSHLSPKVVVIVDKQETPIIRLGSAIVIATSGKEEFNVSTMIQSARKKAPISVVINALEKRWAAFKNELWVSVKRCMENKPSKNSMLLALSLEDLIRVKDNVSIREASEEKLAEMKALASVCHGLDPMEPAEMLEHLRQGIGKHGKIVHVETIDAKKAVYAEFLDDLSESLRQALKQIGVSRLYNHQAEAIQSSLSGKNVVVATSTSSGKSLCYNVPVLDSLSRNIMSCALYIFPTKALAQDQFRTILEMKKAINSDINASIYDGDTSKEDRTWSRNNARLLITNPDMLHVSILPHHGLFHRILSNLRYIVIDEAHAYKGAFGCHAALVLRRLRRICSNVYDSNPTFIFSTATSANPREHAMELANLEDVELIHNDGSPCGPKYFLLWNPPLRLTNRSKSVSTRDNGQTSKDSLIWRRSSPIMEVSYLFAEMVQHGLRCIAFCKTRKLCELVLSYTREILQITAPNLVDTVCVYRAGYIAQDRRKIEADFFDGKLRGVAATNALELGIDVGHIDVTLHLGFPGSVASLWQQAGRSGRRSRPSLAVYVAFDGPLDQYFMKFPYKLFSRPIEHCQVDSHNQKVLEQHISCAAYEYPLCLQYDEKFFGSGLNCAIVNLRKKGYLGNNPSGPLSSTMWNYIGPEGRPSDAFSIRAIEHDKYRVINKLSNEILEEIEESKAFYQVYDGAVYMHQGVTYLVDNVDLSSKIALCRKADVKYYTKTRDYTDVNVVGGDLAYSPVNATEIERVRTTAKATSCRVTTKWIGFFKIWRISNHIFDRVELTLPTYSFDSQAAWIRIPQSIKTTVEMQNRQFRAGSHAASHALLNVVPLYMMCNPSDFGTECANPHETRDIPERILLYDQHPGGIGIVSKVQLLFAELLVAALELVSTCSCLSDTGCPNCVQTLTCSEYNEVLDKEAAILILKGLVEHERLIFEGKEGPQRGFGASWKA